MDSFGNDGLDEVGQGRQDWEDYKSKFCDGLRGRACWSWRIEPGLGKGNAVVLWAKIESFQKIEQFFQIENISFIIPPQKLANTTTNKIAKHSWWMRPASINDRM